MVTMLAALAHSLSTVIIGIVLALGSLTLEGILPFFRYIAAGILILLGIWHLPVGREKSMEWVKAGPEGALPVSTVVNGKGQRPPFYDATLLFLVIEAVEFLAFIASYFYRAKIDFT